MSLRAMAVVWDHYPKGGTEKLALLALADWCNDRGESLHPSVAAVARRVGVSERSIQRLLSSFIAEGVLEVVGNAQGGAPGLTRRYRLRIDRIERMVNPFGRWRGDAGVTPRRGQTGDTSVTPRRVRKGCADSETGDTGVTPSGGSTGDTDVTPTGDTGVTPTGDTGVARRVTLVSETGDTGVTRSVIEPSLKDHPQRTRRAHARQQPATSAGEQTSTQPDGSGSEPADAGQANGTNGATRPLPCPIDRIVEAYHSTLPDQPACAVITPGRKHSIAARWREQCRIEHWQTVDDGLEWFRGFFEHVGRSRWLTGRATDRQGRSFVARLDWLMVADNFAKTLEGVYHRGQA